MDRKHHWAYPSLDARAGSRASSSSCTSGTSTSSTCATSPCCSRGRSASTPPARRRARVRSPRTSTRSRPAGSRGTDAHPALFLRDDGAASASTPRAFADDDAWLHPAARRYRDFLRERSCASPWQAAVALLTIFVEGSVNERGELAGTYVRPSGRGGRARARAREALRLPARGDGADARARRGRGRSPRGRVAHGAASTRRGPEDAARSCDTCEQALSLVARLPRRRRRAHGTPQEADLGGRSRAVTRRRDGRSARRVRRSPAWRSRRASPAPRRPATPPAPAQRDATRPPAASATPTASASAMPPSTRASPRRPRRRPRRTRSSAGPRCRSRSSRSS